MRRGGGRGGGKVTALSLVPCSLVSAPPFPLLESTSCPEGEKGLHEDGGSLPSGLSWPELSLGKSDVPRVYLWPRYTRPRRVRPTCLPASSTS